MIIHSSSGSGSGDASGSGSGLYIDSGGGLGSGGASSIGVYSGSGGGSGSGSGDNIYIGSGSGIDIGSSNCCSCICLSGKCALRSIIVDVLYCILAVPGGANDNLRPHEGRRKHHRHDDKARTYEQSC
jgi:hypothetical protein